MVNPFQLIAQIAAPQRLLMLLEPEKVLILPSPQELPSQFQFADNPDPERLAALKQPSFEDPGYAKLVPASLPVRLVRRDLSLKVPLSPVS